MPGSFLWPDGNVAAVGRDVGRFTDLGEIGAKFNETGKKICHGDVMVMSWFRAVLVSIFGLSRQFYYDL